MGIVDADQKCSDKWIYNFCKRHNLSSRRITHHGQADNRDPQELPGIVYDYIRAVDPMTTDLDADCIFNMDETPVYMDLVGQQTLDFKGSHNVDGVIQ